MIRNNKVARSDCMKIKWLGHSCFKITDKRGVEIVTDPFDDTVGYKVPKVRADIVTVSHGHFDHNFTDAIQGDYELVDKVGKFYVKDIAINGIASYHDKEKGAKRGENTIYTLDIDGIKVCHLGDLGHVPDNKQIAAIGGVDVLLIPVGGHFTIDADEAVEVIDQLKPSIIIPMHYKTPVMNFPIAGVEVFIEKIGGAHRVPSTEIEINSADIKGQRKVFVLNYE